MSEEESFDSMCERLAYYLMRDIARGEGATRMAHGAAHVVLMWRGNLDRIEAAKKKAAKIDKESKA